jgi:hypothetical protein
MAPLGPLVESTPRFSRSGQQKYQITLLQERILSPGLLAAKNANGEEVHCFKWMEMETW